MNKIIEKVRVEYPGAGTSEFYIDSKGEVVQDDSWFGQLPTYFKTLDDVVKHYDNSAAYVGLTPKVTVIYKEDSIPLQPRKGWEFPKIEYQDPLPHKCKCTWDQIWRAGCICKGV